MQKKDMTKEYVERAKAGDKDAFEWIYKNNINKIYYLCLKFLKNEEDAKDITQETFVAVMEKINSLHSPEYFQTWINHIAVNKCKNILVKPERMKFEKSEDFDFEEDIQECNIEFIPEEYAISKEKRNIIMDIIDNKLSDVQRITILLYYYEQFSVEEIATIMECEEGTVKSRLYLGRNIIKKNIEEKERKGVSVRGVTPVLLLFTIFAEDAKANILSEYANIQMLDTIKKNIIGRTGNIMKKSIGLKIVGIVAGVALAASIGIGMVFMLKDNDEENRNDKQTETTYYEGNNEYMDDETNNKDIMDEDNTSNDDGSGELSDDEVVDYIIANNGKVPDGIEDDYVPGADKIVNIIIDGFINLDAETMKPYVKENTYLIYKGAFDRILKDEDSKKLWDETIGSIIRYPDSSIFIVKDLDYVFMSWYTDCYKSNTEITTYRCNELSKQELMEIYEKYYKPAPYTAVLGYEYDYKVEDGYIRFDIIDLFTKLGYDGFNEWLTSVSNTKEMAFEFSGVIFGDREIITDYDKISSDEIGKDNICYIDEFLNKDVDVIIDKTMEAKNNKENFAGGYTWEQFEKCYSDKSNRNTITDYIKNNCTVLTDGQSVAIYYPMDYSLRPLSYLIENDRENLENRNLDIVGETFSFEYPGDLNDDLDIFQELALMLEELGMINCF